ncbi:MULTISPECIES: UDP-N-acetylmuramate--L-alanine ligase [Sorangium]|uniref:UDP-N-acetylmuramate--L-alanine ligase n=1 Tax=Sorangium cellulosum (strain So ce56) TaxID=448385 RepID=MURC_SORC5|nr:UDP-N-acetylmuramate--L-alanine ligase [Sorangium cellulosum]A9FI59.1 RecName: Full=UDP-N-acetylmuramate--L-alanine ligase; AltName: Full=UDP-N-acetylmuramoyl-L-alanine synthetase [Sorangium cellulosum So ce56]CAN91823.1 UDP-N-acetylmuramate-alanine ligase [Sorangium cellulosum So ce56]
MFRGRVRHVHFVGIGGVGMSGLAEILRSLEFEVSGSDLKESSTTRRLTSLGVRIDIGHRAENVRGVDVVVYSSAIRPENPELTEARALGTPVIGRAEMLAELMRVKYGVAIAGSHGKTTTTSLVATVLRAAGLDPTVVVGGKMAALGTNARLGAGDLLVAEADESDGSFLRLTPTIAVVTNIDPEHLDHYGTHERIKDAFVEFAARVPFYGLAVLCLDHPHVQDLLPRIPRRHVTYGVSPQSDYSARGIQFRGLETSFNAYRRGEPLGGFTVKMPGAHNVLNCLATIAVADELEVPLDVTKQALATFGGVARRFTVVGSIGGVTMIDDYGHHPAEIRATIDAARRAFPGEDHRVVVAFQPHRHTRTRDLFDEFTRAFNQADVLLVTDIYAAGEPPIPGVTAERLVQSIREHGHHDARFIADKTDLPEALEKIARPGDVVIALGAGDVNACVRGLKARLEAKSPPQEGSS